MTSLSLRSHRLEIDRSKTCFLIKSPLEELRQFDEYQFESGKDMSFHEVPAMSRAVGFTHNDVREFWERHLRS